MDIDTVGGDGGCDDTVTTKSANDASQALPKFQQIRQTSI